MKQDDRESLVRGRNVFIPFLEQYTELTPEDEKRLAGIMATENEWFAPAAEENEIPHYTVELTSDAFEEPFIIRDNTVPDMQDGRYYDIGGIYQTYDSEEEAQAVADKLNGVELRLLDSYLDGIISKSDYAEKSKRIEDRIGAIQAELKQDEKKLEDVAEIDRLLANIDQAIAEYLDENDNLNLQFILDKMEQVVISPDKVKIQMPSFNREIVVEKIQYVQDSYTRQ